jgi:hypothetical protein
MAKTVFDVLTSNIEESISSATQFLTDGSCKDYAGYMEVCGLIRGLRSAQQEINDLSRNFSNGDDDE